MSKPGLRAVGEDERPSVYELAKTISLPDAIATNDTLLILLVQRRECGLSFSKAGDNTRPQLNNELNKLHVLIAAEESRRAGEEPEAPSGGSSGGRSFDASAI